MHVCALMEKCGLSIDGMNFLIFMLEEIVWRNRLYGLAVLLPIRGVFCNAMFTYFFPMFCLFGIFSPFSPIDLKKDSSALNVSKSQGRCGSTPPPQPKLLSQHPLLKQGNSNTDKTQVAQTHTANGVVAQDQVEREDRRILDRDSTVSTLVPDNSINSSLINGERVSTSRDSLETTASYEGSVLNSCYRTLSSDTLLPSDNEINTNVEEEPNEEIIKQDQPAETKVKREVVFLAIFLLCVYFPDFYLQK